MTQENKQDESALFKGTAWYYARYRPPYPQELFRKLVDRFCLDGAGDLLDLGCGTGELAIPLHGYFERVCAVDEDAGMISEGKEKAKRSGAANIQWISGKAEEAIEQLGMFRLAVIGSAFHWMNMGLVLARVHDRLQPGGGIAVIGGRSAWNGPEQWQAVVVAVIKKWLGEKRRAGNGTYTPPEVRFEDLLAAYFSRVEAVTITYSYAWHIQTLIGYLYSTSFCSRELLGDSAEGFERDLKDALLRCDSSGTFREEMPISVVLAWK